MPYDQKKSQIAKSLRDLVLAYSQAMNHLESTLAILCRELELDHSEFVPNDRTRTPQVPSVSPDKQHLQIDRRLLSVMWRGRSCFLGNTLPYRLLERLARRPNIYVSCEELLADVWRCSRSMSAVRSVVKELRQKLRAAGMEELAEAIDGSVSGHYSLKLDRTS